MAGFNATPAELDQLVTDIRNMNDEVQGVLGGVRNTVDGLKSAWRGSAAQAFDSLMLRYDEDAKKLQEALSTIADGISGTSSDMKQNEEEQGSAMSNIMNRLGG